MSSRTKIRDRGGEGLSILLATPLASRSRHALRLAGMTPERPVPKPRANCPRSSCEAAAGRWLRTICRR
ncbi:hypothetical protein ACP90_02330 [Labrenzia sp. CP4]|nr:hypothetical protein ACP90_02330 [Labrenzia sp. CP4]